MLFFITCIFLCRQISYKCIKSRSLLMTNNNIIRIETCYLVIIIRKDMLPAFRIRYVYNISNYL